MTKIIIQIEREDDARLLEAFAQRLGLAYVYQTHELESEDKSNISDRDWVNEMNGSWNDFPESAEDLIKLIQQNRTIEREIEVL